MEPNQKGRTDKTAELAFLEGDDFFNELEQLESVAGPTLQQPFPNSTGPSSSLPNSHHYGLSQYPSSHQAPYPPYYPPNPQHYQNSQNFPTPHVNLPHNYHAQPNYLSNQNQTNRQTHPSPGPYQGQFHAHRFPAQPPPQAYRQFAHSTGAQAQPAYPHDYHTPNPFSGDSPMQRMQQLATAQHGGPLAQSAAAAAAAEAQAARRISPDGRSRSRRADGEETVRDVLHRQYLEQRRQLEMNQMQHVPPQAYQPGFPGPYPQSSIIPPDQSTPTHSSLSGSATPSDVPRFDSPSAPPTPIFTFPLVTPTVATPPPLVASQPAKSAPSETPAVPVEPLGTLDTDAQKAALIQRLKTAHVMSALQKANTAAMKTDVTVERMSGGALVGHAIFGSYSLHPGAAQWHQAASVVRSLEEKSKKETPNPSSSTRKRTLDETSSLPADTAEQALEPGPRIEINENGEPEKKVYMLVRYCNPNDPEHNPTGVLKTTDQIKEEKEKGDMISFSYTSHIMPYEMVDFRIKKPDGYVDTAAAPVKEGAVPSKLQ